jgi:hypothetical protein
MQLCLQLVQLGVAAVGLYQSINQSISRLSSRREHLQAGDTLNPPVVGSQPAGPQANKLGPDTAKLSAEGTCMAGLLGSAA